MRLGGQASLPCATFNVDLHADPDSMALSNFAIMSCSLMSKVLHSCQVRPCGGRLASGYGMVPNDPGAAV
jgi:hypothetical protein